MFDSFFTPIFSGVSGITVGDFLICIAVALVLGVVAALPMPSAVLTPAAFCPLWCCCRPSWLW